MAKQWVRHDSPLLRAASGAVFCLYMLHQSVIVLLTQALAPLALPSGVEALLLIALTFGVCIGAYAALRHVPGLRLLVGIAPPSRASKPSSGPKTLAVQRALTRQSGAI
jgi:membrane-bound acyltransferase YfiQ involved in biofilm formation